MASLLLLIPRHRKTAAFFGFLAAVNLATILPLYICDSAPPKEGRPATKVMLFNVNTQRGDVKRVERAVREVNPDILLLEEVNRNWIAQLAPVLLQYPYSREAPGEDNFGIALYSRFPFNSAEVVVIGEAEVPSIIAEIRTPSGICTILGTHPLPPAGKEYSYLRNEQLGALARKVRQIKTPVLLVGDLNVTPWNVYFRRLVSDSGLKDSARGWGVQPSWPTMNPILWLPLDHALYSPEIGIVNRRIGPSAGSDHYPLILELVISL